MNDAEMALSLFVAGAVLPAYTWKVTDGKVWAAANSELCHEFTLFGDSDHAAACREKVRDWLMANHAVKIEPVMNDNEVRYTFGTFCVAHGLGIEPDGWATPREAEIAAIQYVMDQETTCAQD